MKNNIGITNKKFGVIRDNWQLYVFILLPIIYIFVFKYMPMYGAQIAFKDYMIREGIWGSEWAGFEHFAKFFNSYQFIVLLRNNLVISVYRLLVGFPFPIILALSLNYCFSSRYKKAVQLTTYAPHFISQVVMVGIVMQLLSPRYGIVNQAISLLGFDTINFMGKPELFPSIFVWSVVWQHTGFESIIYIAALASVDPTMHEAATIDGASKWKRIWHIDIPSVLPTIVVLLILNSGKLMDISFQRVLLFQNPLNRSTSEIIQTYVYNIGISSPTPRYSYATAIGLFNSLVNFFLLITVNKISKKVSETSLW